MTLTLSESELALSQEWDDRFTWNEKDTSHPQGYTTARDGEILPKLTICPQNLEWGQISPLFGKTSYSICSECPLLIAQTVKDTIWMILRTQVIHIQALTDACIMQSKIHQKKKFKHMVNMWIMKPIHLCHKLILNPKSVTISTYLTVNNSAICPFDL